MIGGRRARTNVLRAGRGLGVERAATDVENALVRGAVGDYADEAAVLLLTNFGHWLPQPQAAGLITLVPGIGNGRGYRPLRWLPTLGQRTASRRPGARISPSASW